MDLKTNSHPDNNAMDQSIAGLASLTVILVMLDVMLKSCSAKCCGFLESCQSSIKHAMHGIVIKNKCAFNCMRNSFMSNNIKQKLQKAELRGFSQNCV